MHSTVLLFAVFRIFGNELVMERAECSSRSGYLPLEHVLGT
jgi:hypothetical protein